MKFHILLFVRWSDSSAKELGICFFFNFYKDKSWCCCYFRLFFTLAMDIHIATAADECELLGYIDNQPLP